MIRVITKKGTIDYVKRSMLGFYQKTGYVLAIA